MGSLSEKNIAAGLEALIGSRKFKEAIGIKAGDHVQLTFLAQGEYNRNYTFVHPSTGTTYVLRLNFASQMGLDDQIGYEFHALELLSGSGRTPLPVWVDRSKTFLPCGVLVESFLPGETLRYERDLSAAAGCLADIHSVSVGPEDGLISAGNGLLFIIEECERMFSVFEQTSFADETVKRRIRRLLDEGKRRLDKFDPAAPYYCCINTEVNNGNFLTLRDETGADADTFLVDWEKPLYGEPAQDLGHFLAPTTTFWKTDVILSPDQIDAFVRDYITAVNGRFDVRDLRERTQQYIQITCLRGLTWCAMAWTKYRSRDAVLLNADTAVKLEAYQSDEYLTRIETFFKMKC